MIILNNLVNASQRMEQNKNTQIDIDERYRTKDRSLFLYIRIIKKKQLDFLGNKNKNIQG